MMNENPIILRSQFDIINQTKDLDFIDKSPNKNYHRQQYLSETKYKEKKIFESNQNKLI